MCLEYKPVSNKGSLHCLDLEFTISFKSWIASITTNNRTDSKGQSYSSLHEMEQTKTERAIRLERERYTEKGREKETTTAAGERDKMKQKSRERKRVRRLGLMIHLRA